MRMVSEQHTGLFLFQIQLHTDDDPKKERDESESGDCTKNAHRCLARAGRRRSVQ